MTREAAAQFAPSGTLRAVVNRQNSLLKIDSGAPYGVRGVPIELAQALAVHLGLALDLALVPTASVAFDRVAGAEADLGFLAIDPSRSSKVDFTTPFAEIDITYLAAVDWPGSVEDADSASVRIAVLAGSGYDLFLTRTTENVHLSRAATLDSCVDMLAAGEVDLVAGHRHLLESRAEAEPRWRVLPGRFMSISQALCLPRRRPLALALAQEFIEVLKSDGTIARWLSDSGHGTIASATARVDR